MKALRSFTVRPSLPEELSALETLAMNLRWSWDDHTRDLFRWVDPEQWDASIHDPVRLLGVVSRDRFEQLRDKVRSADDGDGLPEALLHGNLPHAPDHVLRTERGAVAFNWTASGRGPRLADFTWLMRVSWGDPKLIDPAVDAYCRHIGLTDEELDRLEEVMYIRPLYLDAFGYRRSVANGQTPGADVRQFSNRENIRATADATRAAVRRQLRSAG